MKCFEQKLSGFSVIYLHDPFKCYKCIDVMNYEDVSRTYKEYIPQTKMTDWNSHSKCFKKPKENVLLDRKKELLVDPKFVFRKPFEPSPVKIKVLKKKSIKRIHSKTFQALPMNYCKKIDCEPIKSTQKSVKKKTLVDRSVKTSPVKKHACNPDKKLNATKVPGKGTLKRKRWFLSKLNHKNDNYEDDLFEDQKFGHFQNLFEDETDNSEKYDELKTPVFAFSISPRENTPSPTFKDCYNPAELSLSRKGAEEYQYRRRKRRKLCFVDNNFTENCKENNYEFAVVYVSKNGCAVPPRCLEEKKAEAPQVDPQRREEDVQKRLEEVARILNQQKERTSDSEDDHYFSDLLDNSSKLNP